MYGAASRVSQSRGFHPKNRKNIFFLKSSQNHLKRIENHFNIFLIFLKIFFQLGWDRKILEIEKKILKLIENPTVGVARRPNKYLDKCNPRRARYNV